MLALGAVGRRFKSCCPEVSDIERRFRGNFMEKVKVSLSQAMSDAQGYDGPKLSKDEQYERVVEQLVRELLNLTGEEEVFLPPHMFGVTSSLSCEQDDRGSIYLSASKSTPFDAP
jgi:hypothetical protein